MLFDAVVLFFFLGIVIHLMGSNFRLPGGLYQFLSIFLMIAIGLKGGIALSKHLDTTLLLITLAVMVLGIILPLLAYPLLRYAGGFAKEESASVAAHYGSVSVGTFAVAIALLEAKGIAYEPYFPVFVVVLEFPAILVAMYLCAGRSKEQSAISFIKELGTHQSLLLMLGSLLIGLIAGQGTEKLMPFFQDMFHGVLALFLLEMGIVCATQIRKLKQNGLFLISLACLLPLINGLIGAVWGVGLGFSVGGIFLLVVLAASASYIAVPVAMRSMLPDTNHGYGLTASLGVTFPFNILAGLPVYWGLAQWLSTANF